MTNNLLFSQPTMRIIKTFALTAILCGSLVSVLVSRVVAETQTPDVAVGPQYDTTHVYVVPEDVDKFVASFLSTFGGQSTKQVRQAMVQTLYRSKVRFFRKHYGSLYATTLRAGFVAMLRAKWLVLALFAVVRRGARVGPPLRWRDLRSPVRPD